MTNHRKEDPVDPIVLFIVGNDVLMRKVKLVQKLRNIEGGSEKQKLLFKILGQKWGGGRRKLGKKHCFKISGEDWRKDVKKPPKCYRRAVNFY